MTTVALAPAWAAAQATAAPWLPAVTHTRPRSRASSGRVSRRLRAPRALNEPVFWTASSLTRTWAPVRPSRVAEVRTGVRCTWPAIRAAADRTAEGFTFAPSCNRSGGGNRAQDRRPSTVVAVLGAFQGEVDEVHGGVGGPGDQDGEVLGVALGDRLEHVVGRVLAARGAADADADPQEVRGAERLGDVLEAVVAGRAAVAADLELAVGQVDLVVDDDDPVHRCLVPAGQQRGRAPGLVDVAVGPGQHDPGVAVADLGHLGPVAGPLQLGPGPLGQQRDHHGPGVVAAVAVLVVGVAEPEHDPGAAVGAGAGHRGPPPELEWHRPPSPRAGPRPRRRPRRWRPRHPRRPRPPRPRRPRARPRPSARPRTPPQPRGRRGSRPRRGPSDRRPAARRRWPGRTRRPRSPRARRSP